MRKYLLLLLLLSNSVFAGEATLSWTAPTHNEDGTLLTNLRGYFLYYNDDGSTTYPTVINIIDPLAVSYVVPNLTEGVTYYFVATAYNTLNVHSVYSNVAIKTIPNRVPNPPTLLQ